MTRKVVLATGNQGKLRELREMLPGWEVAAQSDYLDVEAEETGLSFVENAILKARHACLHSDLSAIADDSGLEVDALNGQPGIYSARYAGENASDQDNLEKLLKQMDGKKNRRARFRCIIVFMDHHLDPSPLICSGSWEGEIAHAPVGDNGFGYDPIFLAGETGRSAASLTRADKNRLSHRGKALEALIQQLDFKQGTTPCS